MPETTRWFLGSAAFFMRFLEASMLSFMIIAVKG